MRILLVTLAALLALVIGWLAWNSRASDAPPGVPQEPESPAAHSGAEAPSSAPAPEPSKEPIDPQPPAPKARSTSAPAPIDSAQILVHGRVTDAKGEPVPTFGLQWIDDEGVRHDTDGEAGTYATPGLHSGHYLAVVWGTELAREEHEVEIAQRPESQEFDFVAHPQALVPVKVVGADGSPLLAFQGKRPPGPELFGNSLFVAVTRGAPPREWDESLGGGVQYSCCGMFYTRTTPIRGAEIADARVLGHLRLLEPPPLNVSIYSGTQLVATQRIETTPPEMVFTLDAVAIAAQRGAVRMRLVEVEGGSPIGGATVFLHSSAGLLNKNASADGRTQFTDLSPGPYLLQFHAQEHAEEMREIVIDPGQALELGDVPLRTGEALRVLFEYPTKEHPFANCALVRSRQGDLLGPLLRPSAQCFRSDPLAATPVPFPGRGEFELRVQSVDGASGGGSAHLAALPLHLVFGDAPDKEIVVRLQATTAVCLRPPREARANSRWLISTADARPLMLARTWGRTPTRIELIPGEYTIAHIDSDTKALGEPQLFSVGSSFITLDLVP